VGVGDTLGDDTLGGDTLGDDVVGGCGNGGPFGCTGVRESVVTARAGMAD
jgi:hypothetical protein